jgi:hypothetical protein
MDGMDRSGFPLTTAGMTVTTVVGGQSGFPLTTAGMTMGGISIVQEVLSLGIMLGENGGKK